MSLGSYVLAPEIAITAAVFHPQMTREHVHATVVERVRGCYGSLDDWFDSWIIH